MIVLTAGYGPHSELMRIAKQQHLRWASRIGASHRLRYGPEPWPEGTETRNGCWQKILAIQAQLELMGEREVLVWIEPDVLVVDLAADPSKALPEEAEWGMVWRGNEPGVSPHFCTGVQIIRNTEAVRRVLAKVWAFGPQPGLFPGDCRPTNVVLSGGREKWPLGITGAEAAALAYERSGCRIHPLPRAWNLHMSPREPSADLQASAVCLHWSRIDKEVAGRRMREALARVAKPYEPMKRNTPWPELPTIAQITTLEPALASTEARLAGTPVYDCGVLFTHHLTNDVTRRNLESFAKHNPDYVVVPISTERDVFQGSYRLDENDHWRAITARHGRGVWRNVDWAYWLYYAERAYNCKRWLLSDWDVHCTGPLKEFYGATWDADVSCAHPAMLGEPYYWFKEIPRLPAEWRDLAAGVMPVACTLLSDRAMKAMTAAAVRVSYDLFSEVRVGTLARVCGFEIQTIPHHEMVRWTRRPEIRGHGLWHPVKEKETLDEAQVWKNERDFTED